MVEVTFEKEGRKVQVPEGTTVLEAQIRAGLTPDAPCGGAGTCGKCLVTIEGRSVRACQTKAERDLTVDTSHTLGRTQAAILTEGFSHPVVFHPGLAVHPVSLKKADPGERRSDWERMCESLAQSMREERAFSGENETEPAGFEPDLKLASSLYGRRCVLEQWFAVHTKDKILALRQTPGRRYFAAFDLGTTTVVGYLLDAENGAQLAVESCLNPQASYGADVIGRASYALEHGTEDLSACIREAVSRLLQNLEKKAGADPEDIFQICIVGNTCMHHLFLGISPASLVHAPYTPAIRQGLTLRASDYGLTIHPNGQLLMLPNIAGYVGADTCGCLLAVRPDLKEELTLLLDIGTNGEMVLGNKKRMAACSTAAGPALEGAKITCGMRGAAGAVDHVYCEHGVWRWTTVGNRPAVGICGSGLIDLVAQLLAQGLIDESGHLESGQEDAQIFVLVKPEQSGNGKGVFLTQKDIREVQLAKAAIAAGICLLLKALDAEEEDIACIYLAGAFGNYMDPVSAGKIGLIPPALVSRVKMVGNAAGEGAKLALLDSRAYEEAQMLAQKTEFIELAASPEFQDCFVDALSF